MNDGYEDSLAADRDVDRVREEKALREARKTPEAKRPRRKRRTRLLAVLFRGGGARL